MHETKKQKINLIYNHNFNPSLIFYCAGKKMLRLKTTLRALKRKLQAKTKGTRLKATLLPKILISSYLPYFNQFKQVLGKIVNPMQPLAERIY